MTCQTKECFRQQQIDLACTLEARNFSRLLSPAFRANSRVFGEVIETRATRDADAFGTEFGLGHMKPVELYSWQGTRIPDGIWCDQKTRTQSKGRPHASSDSMRQPRKRRSIPLHPISPSHFSLNFPLAYTGVMLGCVHSFKGARDESGAGCNLSVHDAGTHAWSGGMQRQFTAGRQSIPVGPGRLYPTRSGQ